MDNDSHLLSDEFDSDSAKKIQNLGDREKETNPTDTEISEDTDDPLGREDDEAEIVADHKNEDYKEEFTGIKIKYNLTPDEVRRFIGRSKKQEDCKKIQSKHVIIQCVLFAILSAMACFSGSYYYLILAAIPFVALILMWAIPFINLRVAMKSLLSENEFTVDIFPDRLDVESRSGSRTVFLDNTCQSEEYKDMIMVFKENKPGIAIPLRAIDPDFRADVQAIIVAGSIPTNKHYNNEENF